MYVRYLVYSSILFLLTLVVCIPASTQSLISGDVTGIVTDPSGAVLPNATVTLRNTGTGQTQQAATNASGTYRFSLLQPGEYNVTAEASGFQNGSRNVSVVVGQATTLNMQLSVGSSSQTVEVTAEGGVIQTQNGNITTTFTPEQVSEVPNPGNDLSYIVQTAPGAVMNTQSGYGNSPIYGLPGTSNVFTIDGMNENDPFFNVNNSGATNLLLGQNDIQEVTVVSNGYSGQYGQLGGANVNYVSKSGTNAFHGNAIYYWNGRAMNANDYFNNSSGTPRPFSNANQWAASFGGPIKKDKTFFFINTEGLRLIIPVSNPTNIPSPQFQTATLSNLTSTGKGAQIPFYQNMFSLYNHAVGADRAANILPSGGCNGFAGLPAGVPCALQFQSTAPNATNEWLLTARVDQNFSDRDRMFIHFRTDHGSQATYTDPISPLFNAQSVQPQYEGQLNWTHTLASQAVNQFVLSGSWYSAIFGPPNLQASLAAFPYNLSFAGAAFALLGGENSVFPQGRNDTQYQITDDFSKVIGAHNLKFGMNFRRNDITDFNPQLGSIGFSSGETLGNFFNGVGSTYIQNFPKRLSEPIALYGLGFYAQDEFAASKELKITLGLRVEHNSNPVCQTDCFARFGTSFQFENHNPNVPYNQSIRTGLRQALINTTNIQWEPRIGFAWTPLGPGTNTVLRGGVGIFADIFPGTVADSFIRNAPVNNQFTVGVAPLDPALSNSQSATAALANVAFNAGFAAGGTLTSISNSLPAGVIFSPPNMNTISRTTHNPQYQEWNLELQQGFGQKTALSINYVGNHGIFEPIQNAGLNAYCNSAPLPFSFSANTTPCLGQLASSALSFGGLPLAPMDPRFGVVTEVQSSGVSNYNGMTVSFLRRFSQFQFQANYTWSHAIDEISNGGFLPFGAFPITNISFTNPIDPFNLRQFNYGNADYDARHYFSANYVWNTPKVDSKKLSLIEAWTVSGTIFYRTGYPFSVIDSGANGILNSFNYGTTAPGGPNLLANTSSPAPISCDRSAVNNPCFGSQFSPVVSGFGFQRRNQLYGPNFFDTDLTVMKNFKIPLGEAGNFGVGLQFFNLFNHANFDQPIGDVASTQIGLINKAVSVPTSILGSFLNGDASPRMIQIKGTLSF
jgi:Carboxypeptidase regulatory-like domain